MRDRSNLVRWPRDIIAILSALAALLIYSQYTTLLKFAVLRPACRYASLAIFMGIIYQSKRFPLTIPKFLFIFLL